MIPDMSLRFSRSSRFVACATMVATALHAIPELQAAPPRAWTWDPPSGPAASDPSLVPMVRTFVPWGASPELAADETAARAAALGATAGRLAIVPLGLGRDLLVGHPSDWIHDPSVPAQIRGGTPWTEHGRAAMGEWMDRYIARYQLHQATSGLPAPDRFHLDSELRLPALRYLPDVSDVWGLPPMQLFAAMQLDPRWDSEAIPFAPGCLPANLTLAAQYAAHGSPRYDPASPRDAPVNRSWSAWWDAMTREAVEGAFDAAVFARIRSAWPHAASSGFAESMRLDGAPEPDGSARSYVDFEWWDRGWMRSHWCGRGDLQAPALYLFGSSFLAPGEEFWRGNMRLHRANLDACLHSFGGVPPAEVTPWVTLPRIALPAGRDAPDRAVSDDEFVELMALLRGRGIDEFQLWPGGDSELWSAARRGIRAAWDCTLLQAEVIRGAFRGEPTGSIERADRSTLSLGGTTGAAEIVATFDTPGGGGNLWVAFEGARAAGAGASIALEVRAASGRWIQLASIDCASTLPGARWIGPVESADLATPAGTVELRLTIPGGTTILVDLLQVVHAAHPVAPSPDINGDGTVSAPDLSILLADWGGVEARSDLDRSGTVGPADLAILLSAWSG